MNDMKTDRLRENTSTSLRLLRDFYVAFHKPEWEEGETAEAISSHVRVFLDQAAADGWDEAIVPMTPEEMFDNSDQE